MIDVAFYMKVADYKRKIMAGMLPRAEEAYDYLESIRSKYPVVFNIESTNSCNMACSFCPRTTKMTRPVKTMDPKIFSLIASQLKPHTEGLWADWLDFAQKEYKIPLDEQSENAFFLYVLPRVVVLHGYGDPLLDPHIPAHILFLSLLDIPTYFSCNHANIRINRLEDTFKNGLGYIKFSVDSVTSPARGKDQWDRDYRNIMDVLNMKARGGYSTQIVVTMIDLGRDEFAQLQHAFVGTDVYLYQKSLDQAWMIGGEKPKSIHWSEPCQFPWSSMTVNSSGLVVPCGEDYDADMVMGDVTKQTLEEIWNGPKYAKLRRWHINTKPTIRCNDGSCDMKTIGLFL